MDRIPISSSNIRSIGHEADSLTLEIEFVNGRIYQYSGVPTHEYEAFISADSKGRYFNAQIKGRYPEARL